MGSLARRCPSATSNLYATAWRTCRPYAGRRLPLHGSGCMRRRSDSQLWKSPLPLFLAGDFRRVVRCTSHSQRSAHWYSIRNTQSRPAIRNNLGIVPQTPFVFIMCTPISARLQGRLPVPRAFWGSVDLYHKLSSLQVNCKNRLLCTKKRIKRALLHQALTLNQRIIATLRPRTAYRATWARVDPNGRHS